MNLLWETLSFAAKGAIVALTVSLIAAVIFSLARRGRRRSASGTLQVQALNPRIERLSLGLKAAVLGRAFAKQAAKDQKKKHKLKEKEQRDALEAETSAQAGTSKPSGRKPSVFVLEFEGDLMATRVTGLREEVTALIQVAQPADEVVVRLESPGGSVAHYGLAAAQLTRLKNKNLKVTVCVDRVAASGGYLMAAVADQIVAAPFAVIGSIGVVAQVPNLHRLLKRHEVDYEEMTAGEFKRTVSVLGEITEKGRAKFQEQLEETHQLFKAFVKAQRPKLNVEQVATGEYWLGTRALELGLVDSIGTSDDYLLDKLDHANLFKLEYRPEVTLRDRLGQLVSTSLERTLFSLLSKVKLLELS